MGVSRLVPTRMDENCPGSRNFAPTAQRISPWMPDTTYMQAIEISDKTILAHRHGKESINKTIERKYKQKRPEKESKALQEIDEIRKGKFYTRTQVEESINGFSGYALRPANLSFDPRLHHTRVWQKSLHAFPSGRARRIRKTSISTWSTCTARGQGW